MWLVRSAGPEREARCIRLLLRPVVTLLIRNGVPFQRFMALAREVYVDVAKQILRESGKKINESRLSVLTGLSRSQVKDSFDIDASPEADSQYGMQLKVLAQWEQDKRFTDRSGRPRVLSYGGERSEFRTLVETVSKHLHPGTVLFELERVHAVKRTARGIQFLRGYQQSGEDPARGFEVLSQDISALLEAGAENIFGRPAISNLHLHTSYDNVAKRELPQIRRWLIREGKIFHKRVRDYLSRFDLDITPIDDEPDVEGGACVSVGAFSVTTPIAAPAKSLAAAKRKRSRR